MEQETILEQLEQELEELFEDLEALEKQYNNPAIKEGKTDIWSDIKYTNEQIQKVEDELRGITSSKSR